MNTGSLTVTVLGAKKKGDEYKHIMSERHAIAEHTTDTTEKVSVNIGSTIPGVFGDYSSLKVEIGVIANGNPKNLEQEAEYYTNLIVPILVSTLNKVSVLCGKPPVFK